MPGAMASNDKLTLTPTATVEDLAKKYGHLRAVQEHSDDWKPGGQVVKRDFQELNPPKTVEEFYAKYDPSVGIGTGVLFGSFLMFIIMNVVIKWSYRRYRRMRRRGHFNKIARALNMRVYQPLTAQQVQTRLLAEKSSEEQQEALKVAKSALKKTASVPRKESHSSVLPQLDDDEDREDSFTLHGLRDVSIASTFSDTDQNRHDLSASPDSFYLYSGLAPHLQIIQPTPCVTPCPSMRQIQMCECSDGLVCQRCQNTLRVPTNRVAAIAEVHPYIGDSMWSLRGGTPPAPPSFRRQRALSCDELGQLIYPNTNGMSQSVYPLIQQCSLDSQSSRGSSKTRGSESNLPMVHSTRRKFLTSV